jgi:hypothetical protein
MTYNVPEGGVDLEYAKKGGLYVPNKDGRRPGSTETSTR